MNRDDLEDYINERERKEPGFKSLVEEREMDIIRENPYTKYLMAGGKAYLTERHIEHDLKFDLPDSKIRNPDKVDKIIVHWTGGKRPPEKLFETLTTRGLSVHFGIGLYGEIYQYADALTYKTSHAGKFNSTSIGIEVVAPGYIKRKTTSLVTTSPKVQNPECLWKQKKVKVNGWKFNSTIFMKPQMNALSALIADLLEIVPNIQPSVEKADRTLEKIESGIYGHYHLTRNKIDPGPYNMELLEEAIIDVYRKR